MQTSQRTAVRAGGQGCQVNAEVDEAEDIAQWTLGPTLHARRKRLGVRRRNAPQLGLCCHNGVTNLEGPFVAHRAYTASSVTLSTRATASSATMVWIEVFMPLSSRGHLQHG